MLAIWPFSSGTEIQMTPSAGVPAAEGSVNVQKSKDNGNTKLDIKVRHLAKPASLTPSEGNYVVWVRPNGEPATSQGEIRVDNDLNGELKAVTASKDFDLLITAEQSGTANSPTGVEVLHAHVARN
jgi:hypothetical protein